MTWLVLLAVAAVLWLAFPPGTPADRLKLHWHEWFFLFFSSSFIGCCLETLFVWLGSGVLMSRSSLLYGPFSIVWGLGALLMTLVLVPLSRRGPLVLFLGGAVLGGGFEYLASLFLERVFHRLFWNYAHLPLNLDGRTNLLYAAFWGVAGMLWVYWLAPLAAAPDPGHPTRYLPSGRCRTGHSALHRHLPFRRRLSSHGAAGTGNTRRQSGRAVAGSALQYAVYAPSLPKYGASIGCSSSG